MVRNLNKVALKSYMKRNEFKAYRFGMDEKPNEYALGFFFVGDMLVVFDEEGIEINNRRGAGERGGFRLRARYNDLSISGGRLRGPGFELCICPGFDLCISGV